MELHTVGGCMGPMHPAPSSGACCCVRPAAATAAAARTRGWEHPGCVQMPPTLTVEALVAQVHLHRLRSTPGGSGGPGACRNVAGNLHRVSGVS
jgi:hypothetical protein